MLQIQETNLIKKEAEKILKYKEITIEIQRTWNVTTKVISIIPIPIIIMIIIINRCNWNRLQTIHTAPKQHKGKAQCRGTTEESQHWALFTHYRKPTLGTVHTLQKANTGHCSHTTENTNVKVQNI